MGEIFKIDFEENLRNHKNYEMDEIPQSRSDPSFKRPKKKRDVYLPKERIQAIMNDYETIVVHDFGDEYHLTNEERRKKNRYYELFEIVNKSRNNAKKIGEYVAIMRNYINCLNAIAENNGVYNPDEFRRLFFKGKIFINGLKDFPKYKGKDRKEISWEYITDFILSDEDIKELQVGQNRPDEIYDENDIERFKHQLFDDAEYREILNASYHDKTELLVYDPDNMSQDDSTIVAPLTEKSTKKLLKKSPELVLEIRNIKRSLNGANLDSMIYDLDSDDFAAIDRYDRKHNFTVSSKEIPEFTGDILNDDDYNRYMNRLTEYEETQVKEEYNGKLRTKEEIQELELKSLLEENGWNIRNLYDNRDREKRLKKALKRDKEREKRLKARLTKLQERRTLAGKSETVKKKKKDKKNKKNKDKGKKWKKEAKESSNNILMNNIPTAKQFSDFDEYKDGMTDWSWDSIMAQDID